MNQLELKYIQHYDLKTLKFIVPEVSNKIKSIIRLDIHLDCVECYEDGKKESWSIRFIKPLLRPMSDLYKERNGKIDIVELFRLLCVENEPIEDFKLQVRPNMLVIDRDFMFYYNRDGAFRYYSHRIDGFIPNQLALFEHLFANHYDIYGLIDQDLAIDINTLP